MAYSQPNILLITTDQQRYDALGINGNPVLRTPNLDALAARGTNFSRCYITCPICIPARRSLLSGLHPDTHGMPGYREGWAFDPPHTLPGCLSAAGYQTQLVGKLHMHPQRKRYGYDHMILSDSANDRPTSLHQAHNDYTAWLRDRGMTHHSNAHGIGGNGRVARPWTLGEELHHTSWVAEQSARFFDTTRDPSVPWFLHVSFVAPHPPLIPPQAYWDRYIGRDDLRPTIASWAPNGPPRKGTAPDAKTGPFDPAEIHDAIAGYYGLINHIDDRIAYLIDRFFEHGNPRSQEPTYILFSSDHGEMLGDHHLFRKTVPYEPSTHVPLFISGRNIDVPRGACEALCGWEDLMPTVLDLAGVPVPDGLDGQSLLPVMRGQAPGVREVLHGLCIGMTRHRYLVAGRYKYIWFTETHEEQLFDLETDPHELHDLSADAGALEPMRALMAPVATRTGYPYDRAALKPCANRTPAALGF
jgi:arylsulfatase A-like enzyme